MQFISKGLNPHLKALHLDIEPSQDIEHIKKSPKPFIAWNYYANKELFDYSYSHDKEAYCVERGALPDTIFIDGGGFNVLSKSYQEHNWNHEMPFKQRHATLQYITKLTQGDASLEPQGSSRMSSVDFKIATKCGQYRKVVFVPLQLNTDTVIKYFSGWVGSVENFIGMICDIAERNPDILFLVKNHPLKINVTESENNICVVDNLHYKDCLQYSDLVCVINSGVGLQSMAFNKPTLVCGDAFYQFADVNYKINSLDELSDAIPDYYTPPNSEKVIRFYSWLIHEFYSFVTMIKPKPNLNRMQIKEIHTLRFYK